MPIEGRSRADYDHRDEVVSRAGLVPLGAEIYAHDPRDLSVAVENGAVGAVEASPSVLVGLLVNVGCAVGGIVEGFGVLYLLAEFAGVVGVGVDGEGELIALVANAVDVGQLDMVKEGAEYPQLLVIFRRGYVLGGHISHGVAVEHTCGGVRDIEHSRPDKRLHGAARLPYEDNSEEHVRGYEKHRGRRKERRGYAQLAAVLQSYHIYQLRKKCGICHYNTII